MNSSGQMLYRTSSLEQKPVRGCYETFWAIGAAGLLEDHFYLHALKYSPHQQLFTGSSFNDIVSIA
jgi:hypothetical protein